MKTTTSELLDKLMPELKAAVAAAKFTALVTQRLSPNGIYGIPTEAFKEMVAVYEDNQSMFIMGHYLSEQSVYPDKLLEMMEKLEARFPDNEITKGMREVATYLVDNFKGYSLVTFFYYIEDYFTNTFPDLEKETKLNLFYILGMLMAHFQSTQEE